MLPEPVEYAAPAPRPLPWKAWPTVGLAAVIFIVYSTVQLVTHLIVALATLAFVPAGSLEQFLNSLTTNGLAISVSGMISAPVGLFLTAVFIRLRRGPGITEYLDLRPLKIRALLALLAATLVLTLLLELLGLYLVQTPEDSIILEAYKNSVWPPLFWIAVVIFIPVFEEVLFRGFAFRGLERSRVGAPGAILITAGVWALLHVQYNWFGMTSILILGIVLGFVRLKVGLWGTIAMHSFWNLLAMVGTVLYLSGAVN